MKRLVLSCTLLFLALSARSQTPIVAPDLSVASRVSPAYFGPNAFPVPDVPDGRVQKDIYAEFAADFYQGTLSDGSDYTYDAFFRVRFPLFSRRASLELWMPVVEYWDFSPAVAAARNIPDAASRERWQGHDSGDIYVCTNIQILEGRANSLRPDILLRAVLKSASGNAFSHARFHDAAGYFFDGTLTWSRRFENSFLQELRGGVNAGFLCWQTGTARQNDAVQYGLVAIADTHAFTLTTDYAGYVGWEGDGDHPRRIRLRLDGHLGRWMPFFQYTLGTNDYPFHGFRAGIACRFGVGL